MRRRAQLVRTHNPGRRLARPRDLWLRCDRFVRLQATAKRLPVLTDTPALARALEGAVCVVTQLDSARAAVVLSLPSAHRPRVRLSVSVRTHVLRKVDRSLGALWYLREQLEASSESPSSLAQCGYLHFVAALQLTEAMLFACSPPGAAPYNGSLCGTKEAHSTLRP